MSFDADLLDSASLASNVSIGGDERFQTVDEGNPGQVKITQRFSAIASPKKRDGMVAQRRMTEPISPSEGLDEGVRRKRLSIAKFEDLNKAITEDQPPSSVGATLSPSKFFVRDMRYKEKRKKAPSLPPMYTIKGAVCFNTKEKVDSAVEVCREMWEGDEDEEIEVWLRNEFGLAGVQTVEPEVSLQDDSIPPIVVVHWQLPFSNNGLFGKKKEDGGQIAFFFEISEEFAQECNDLGEEERGEAFGNAGKLLRNWLRNAEDDFALRSRFKAIMLIEDLATLGLDYLSSYNGKPVLIQKTGAVFTGNLPSGRKFLEMRCDVHGWGIMSKRGLVSVIPRIKDMTMDMGFVIEGREEDELPERLLGACRVKELDPSSALEL